MKTIKLIIAIILFQGIAFSCSNAKLNNEDITKNEENLEDEKPLSINSCIEFYYVTNYDEYIKKEGGTIGSKVRLNFPEVYPSDPIQYRDSTIYRWNFKYVTVTDYATVDEWLKINKPEPNKPILDESFPRPSSFEVFDVPILRSFFVKTIDLTDIDYIPSKEITQVDIYSDVIDSKYFRLEIIRDPKDLHNDKINLTIKPNPTNKLINVGIHSSGYAGTLQYTQQPS